MCSCWWRPIFLNHNHSVKQYNVKKEEDYEKEEVYRVGDASNIS